MKTPAQIRRRIKEIEADDRYYYGKPGRKPATVFENAPLALIQTSMESQVSALRWVLKEVKA